MPSHHQPRHPRESLAAVPVVGDAPQRQLSPEFESEGDPTHVAVKIRLKRMGKIRAPHYRIVVADVRTKRDGVTIEEIGVYNPKLEPSLIRVDAERVAHWLSVGAQPTESVQALLSKTGDWQKFKGEPAPPPLLEQPMKRGRRELFDEALAASHSELRTEAVTAKKAAAKAAEPKAEKSTEPKAEKKAAEPKAEKSTEPKAEKKAAEPKAEKSTEPKAEKKAAEPQARKAVDPSAASTDVTDPAADAPEAGDQPGEAKADEAKADEAKADEAKADDAKADDAKADDTKSDQPAEAKTDEA